MMALVFAWINLVIYSLIGRHAYHKWFKSRLRSSIASKQAKLQDLQSSADQLENQVSSLKTDLKLQDEQFSILLKKLKLWNEAVVSNQKNEHQELIGLQHKIDKNNQIKMQNLALNLAQKKVLTKVVGETTNILYERFRKPENVDKMMLNVFKKLESL